jgi:hypothetical protein
MKFNEFIEAKDYPVAQRVQPPPVLQSTPSPEELHRLVTGPLHPLEKAIIKKQKEELRQYGVVFTPFKFYGGMKNPQPDSFNF